MSDYAMSDVILRRVARLLTVGVMVFALSISAALRPAQASSSNADAFGAFLGAAATLFILGSVLDSGSKPDPAPTAKPPRAVPEATLSRRTGRGASRNPAALPAQCLRRVKDATTRYAVSARCLKQEDYRSARRLPQACRLNMRAGERLIKGYSLRCLRKRGYQTTHAR